MRPYVLAAAVALLSAVPAPAHAQTAPVVFTTVDAVKIDHNNLVITGVVQGEPAPSDRTFFFNFSASSSQPYEQRQSCERLALIAMAKPGQYLLEVRPGFYDYTECKLSRVKP